jgi:hypothetical protein
MRRSCRPIEVLRRRAFLDRFAPAARARRLREDEQVERLALARDIAARQRKGALRIALDDEREHRLLAAVEDARLGALVREGDPVAHLGDVLRRRGAARQRSGDHARRSRTVSRARLALERGQRFAGAALRDQEVGIGDCRVGVRAELEHIAIRSVRRRGATVAILELGERRGQPAARSGGQAARCEQRLEAAPCGCGLAAQRCVLGQARGLVHVGTGRPAARIVRLGVAALHAQHRRQRQPGLRLPLAAGPARSTRQVRDGGIELVQVLLERRAQEAARRRAPRSRRARRATPQRQPAKRGSPRLARLLEIASRDTPSQASRRPAVPPGACAS